MASKSMSQYGSSRANITLHTPSCFYPHANTVFIFLKVPVNKQDDQWHGGHGEVFYNTGHKLVKQSFMENKGKQNQWKKAFSMSSSPSLSAS